MLLLVDAGNSYIKWNLATDPPRRLVLESTRKVDWQSNIQLNDMFAKWSEYGSIDRAIMCSVITSNINDQINQWLRVKFDVQVERAQAQRRFIDITNAYQQPEQLGADRWVAMIAARTLFPNQNLMVVGCGTALTIDALNADGTHKGGLIFPGAVLMEKCLLEKTNIKLPRVEHKTKHTTGNGLDKRSLYNNDSASAVRSGVYNMLIRSLNSMAGEIIKDFDNNCMCVISGGYAQALIPQLTMHCEHQPDLVINGLLAVADHT